MDMQIFFLLAGVVILAALFLFAISFTKKTSKLNQVKYQQEWLKVNSSLDKKYPASYTVAIFNADKLLDQALRELGVPGETMGERMKNAKNRWSNADKVWGAHKMRNRLAHESGVEFSYGQTTQALSAFKQALKDLGAI